MLLELTAKMANGSEIELDVDMPHMILTPGESMNLTLTIHNNGSSIETYDVEIDSTVSPPPAAWTVTPTSNTVSNVLPTYNSTLTVVVQLDETATPSDNGMFTIIVSESDGTASSTIDVYVSVAIVYNPHLDATGVGDQGLLAIDPGQSVDLLDAVSNFGVSRIPIFSVQVKSQTSVDGGPTIPLEVLPIPQRHHQHGRLQSAMSHFGNSTRRKWAFIHA